MNISMSALASENFDAVRTTFIAAVLAVDVADDRHAAGVLAHGIDVPVAAVDLVPKASDCGMREHKTSSLSKTKGKVSQR
eukprot:6176195-Pleurochrysis_carterae.AAC.2